MTHLGYPIYFMKILGTAKLVGVAAILYGRFSRLKEWAYADSRLFHGGDTGSTPVRDANLTFGTIVTRSTATSDTQPGRAFLAQSNLIPRSGCSD